MYSVVDASRGLALLVMVRVGHGSEDEDEENCLWAIHAWSCHCQWMAGFDSCMYGRIFEGDVASHNIKTG